VGRIFKNTVRRWKEMTIINLITQFFNLVTLAGIIILTRFIRPFWAIVIGTVLVILGLVMGGGVK
jgi:hypothetical protein